MCSWYLARDTLGGRNFMDQDVKKAVVLLRDCRHDEARWLTSMFSGRSIATKQDVENALEDALLTQGDDPRALCFGSLFQTNSDGDVRLRKAAQLG
jgi:7-keto-8-aminopelargonate synthetase-like enzyme